ncbi:uncharacterized protein EHS24_004347 [Apiotrichum porosum]|uniref:Transmembrane protein n=1 Tax=Apiotrichum porosum TaxID=105984 RepID=A0A427Y4W0_9TREE|nr:uncharacterized protein EHS24_004347 [Apiotrichum porosum]RSH86121.1 hypothetical protein EHS24_004347 [Apiotrichum porosum]
MSSTDTPPPAAVPAHVQAMDDDDPKEYKPSPKVAVVVAGAAFALTTGLTLMVFPFVRQAAKMSQRTEFMSHAHRSRPLRTPRVPIQAAPLTTTAPAPAPAPAAPAPALVAPAALTSASTSTPIATVPQYEPVHPVLEAAREFNDKEEDSLWGPTIVDEEGKEVEPASPFLGIQALGIATALVGGFTALGVWVTAKVLGVSSMEEFTAKMRENVEESMPEFIENVRRESEEPAPEIPDLLDRKGIDLHEGKLYAFVKSWGYGDEDK